MRFSFPCNITINNYCANIICHCLLFITNKLSIVDECNKLYCLKKERKVGFQSINAGLSVILLPNDNKRGNNIRKRACFRSKIFLIFCYERLLMLCRMEPENFDYVRVVL